MKRDELHDMIDRWEAAPDDPETCDLLCDVAEAMGLDDREWQVDELRNAIDELDD